MPRRQKSVKPFAIEDVESPGAFAMIVDINGFTPMVERGMGQLVEDYTRDVLSGGIVAVERHGGHVVGFMGDAFYALLGSAKEVFECCIEIATDVDKQCEYISCSQEEAPEVFAYSPGGPSLKIGIEFGQFRITEISSSFLKEQKLFIGPAVNYASRITRAGKGNRCLVGPQAAEKGLSDIATLRGPFTVRGKRGEKPYTYFEVDLDDIWWTGGGKRTYWDL